VGLTESSDIRVWQQDCYNWSLVQWVRVWTRWLSTDVRGGSDGVWFHWRDACATRCVGRCRFEMLTPVRFYLTESLPGSPLQLRLGYESS